MECSIRYRGFVIGASVVEDEVTCNIFAEEDADRQFPPDEILLTIGEDIDKLLGVKGFSRNGIQTDGHGEIVFYLVSPTDISVLSRAAVAQKIKHLMTLLSAQPDLEIVCIDARENFDNNKLYLD